jgi:hypothetical protein
MTENNQNKNSDDSIIRELNKQTSLGSESEHLKEPDADQGNGGGASLSKNDVLTDQNGDEDTTPLYELVSTEPEDDEEELA